jgi:hypothetical protein
VTKTHTNPSESPIMKRMLLALAASAAMLSPVYAATSDADCQAAWVSADQNKDGVLDAKEAGRYNAALRVAEKPVTADNTVTDAVFLENCKAGVFDTAKAEEGAPFEGANSFTEGQAQDRVVAAGYSNVSALTKDEKGIWRGTAEVNGKAANVAVDFKGNVVSN